jgi:uncharacterized protein (TIGR02996 family)
MTDEAAFLAAVEAAPHDAGLRLVYADWLDERGDPRGELVRVEEEMGRLPVFADRFWELKPRRNELRSQSAPEWLVAMRYGTDYQPVFGHGVPDDWRGRWRLLREFTERWYRIPMPDVGDRADEVREAEERLGRSLPPSLREWVALRHNVPQNPDHDPIFRDTYQMRDLEGSWGIALLQRGEEWGAPYTDLCVVRIADLASTDPPVYQWNPTDARENSALPIDSFVGMTVSAFAFEFVMGYGKAPGGGFMTDLEDVADLVRNLEATFPVRCRFGQTDIYESENIMVRLSPSILKSHTRLEVDVARPMRPDALPAFLLEYRNYGGSFHGPFNPDPIRNPEQPS